MKRKFHAQFLGGCGRVNRPHLPGATSRVLKMRKQYYIRSSERGLLAWDVDRLVKLSKLFPRIHLPLTAIREFDEPFGQREILRFGEQ